MAIKIGSLSLDDSYSPSVKVSYEYNKTQSQEIIGGSAVYTISGRVVVTTSGNTGAVVMSKLAGIRDIGKSTECVQITIPGFYSGSGKISNVSIDQGSDPSWVNQGEFSIEIKCPLSSLPSNSLNLKAEDYVTDISISEVLEIGEESHSFYYSGAGGTFSKGFVKFTNKISVTCKPLCSSEGTPASKSMEVLKKLVKLGPTSSAMTKYAAYSKLLQSRTLEINSEGTVTFSASMIMGPNFSDTSALVDITFNHNENYQDKSRKYTISGTINGLVNVPYSDLISMGSMPSKIASAEAAFGAIKGRFSNFASWAGNSLTSRELPNCPLKNLISSACSSSNDTINTCVEPLNTTVSKSRTEGTINFTFEWGTANQQEGCSAGGVKTEITIDVQDPQPHFVEHVIPRYGTLIQDINCKSAKKVSFTHSRTTDGSSCSSSLNCDSTTEDPTLDINSYIAGNFLLIGHSITSSRTSYVVKKEYIEGCV